MDTIYDTIDEGHVSEERRERADSPAEAREQLYSEVQVHASAEEERGSPDYMEIKEDRHSCSSPSSSDDDDEEEVEEVRKVAEHQVEVEVEVVVEPEPAAEVKVEQVNGEARDGSRRSSASSASSVSHGDPCDDPPIQPKTLEEEEDGMLMAYNHPDADPKTEESVDYTLATLENLSVDDSSAAPADPDQPEISLFTKVRLRRWDDPCSFNLSKSAQNTEKKLFGAFLCFFLS